MKKQPIIAATFACLSLASTSEAVGIFGLGNNGSLYQFDSAAPGSVIQIGSNGSFSDIVDIDFHGANGLLYGMTSTGLLSTINTVSGARSLVTTPLSALSGLTAMDFNPLADRVRLAGTGGFNARITPNFQTAPTAMQANGTVTMDGTYSFFQSDTTTARPGVSVLGAGYTNPSNNPSSTILYTLSGDNFLNRHTTPAGAFGNGVAVGPLGYTQVGAGFDIDINGLGYGYDGTNLRAIQLSDGSSNSLGAIGLPLSVTLQSLAVVPEPSSALLFSLASLGLLRRRVR